MRFCRQNDGFKKASKKPMTRSEILPMLPRPSSSSRCRQGAGKMMRLQISPNQGYRWVLKETAERISAEVTRGPLGTAQSQVQSSVPSILETWSKPLGQVGGGDPRVSSATSSAIPRPSAPTLLMPLLHWPRCSDPRREGAWLRPWPGRRWCRGCRCVLCRVRGAGARGNSARRGPWTWERCPGGGGGAADR